MYLFILMQTIKTLEIPDYSLIKSIESDQYDFFKKLEKKIGMGNLFNSIFGWYKLLGYTIINDEISLMLKGDEYKPAPGYGVSRDVHSTISYNKGEYLKELIENKNYPNNVQDTDNINLYRGLLMNDIILYIVSNNWRIK